MSLGFRRDADHIAERAPVRVPRGLPQAAPVTAPKKSMIPSMVMGVPRGLVPTLTYSLFAFLAPLLFLYMDYDFTTDTAKGITIGLSAIAAVVVVLANDCCCWYNMMLAFHTALEVKVIDKTLTFAYASGTSDGDMALAIVGAIIVIVHLVPFYVSDRLMLLGVLAFAGVIVNATLLVFLDSSMLLLVGASSLALLAVTMIISGVCEIKTSLLSLIRESVIAKKCITCEKFEL
jgi:hypothetical protein